MVSLSSLAATKFLATWSSMQTASILLVSRAWTASAALLYCSTPARFRPSALPTSSLISRSPVVPSWTPTVLPFRSSRLWMAWVEASLAAPEAALLAASEAALEAEAAVEELVLEQAVRARAADRPTTARKRSEERREGKDATL